jgi:hypothetical protein
MYDDKLSIMKTIKLASILLSVFLFTACSDYLDVNSNPSFPQQATAQVLLPPILQEMVAGEAFDSRFIGKYVQNFATVTANDSWDQHGYSPGNDNGGQIWRNHYWGIGLNAELIIQDAEANQKWWYSGVAKAIRAWSWQTTTDYHGEIILDQAWDTARYVFEYDLQEDVYAEVVRLCEEALIDLDKDDQTNTLSKGDLVYKGERDKWKKFVYAVLARNAHHVSNKSFYDPDKVIEYVDKSFAGNIDNFNVPHAGTNTSDANFFGPLRNNLGSFRQTAFVLSLLNGTVFTGVTDPRLPHMFTNSADGLYYGVTPTLGDPNSAAGNTKRIPNLWGTLGNTSTTGKYIYQDKADFPIITYAELQFMKAEAAFIKGDAATALTAYANGINAHMDFVANYIMDATAKANFATNRATYMTSAAVAQTEGELTLSHIMLQKYIALIGHGIIETWVDLRRYHYDPVVYTGFTLPTALYPDNGGKPAYRVRPRYNSEYIWNLKSLSVYGGDKLDYHTYEQWFSTAE